MRAAIAQRRDRSSGVPGRITVALATRSAATGNSTRR
jgi:hypothetical protein